MRLTDLQAAASFLRGAASDTERMARRQKLMELDYTIMRVKAALVRLEEVRDARYKG